MRLGRWARTSGLLAAALLAGCDSQDGAEHDTAMVAARQAAEAELRGLGGTGTVLRGVHAYRQARDGATAVCGQVNLQDAGAASAFTLFVSVVTPREGGFAVEQHVATSGPTASRVFVETLLRCYEDGGPLPGQRPGAPPPMPPVPDRLPAEARAPVPPAPVSPGPAAPPLVPPVEAPQETATLRQNGNLRAHPNGGGALLRIVPSGTTVKVYGHASGGWLQVGDAQQPWGWMHNSLMR
ncbi:SH3 domain-containing protein [Pseudoroseomonas globiformis]|uniref:SH3 domain-containing protein n=1 Tax=Teichococcus globiformis TaxID=2307229 RepID=A0ABV7G9P7_9PROT